MGVESLCRANKRKLFCGDRIKPMIARSIRDATPENRSNGQYSLILADDVSDGNGVVVDEDEDEAVADFLVFLAL
jgi:hypothetical protein